MESYFTLHADVEATGEFVDRKSRFIAQLVHIESEEEANDFIAAVRARHYDARHNVPAWICTDGRERQSDDGEPSRTSGMPTLEVLRGEGLKDICCVTTRYFGGTLLGPGGLVRAYTAAAQAAVAHAREAGMIVKMTSVTPVECSRLITLDTSKFSILPKACGCRCCLDRFYRSCGLAPCISLG